MHASSIDAYLIYPLKRRIKVNHVWQKLLTVLPLKVADGSIMDKTHLAGQRDVCPVIGVTLLLTGNIKLGYVK